MKKYSLIAACASGIESLVADELQGFGGEQIRKETAVVTCQGTLESAYRCCLWSRFSSRVLIEIGKGQIKDEESLYDFAMSVDWQDHMDCDTTFAVGCTISKNSPITHSRYAALKVKDGLVDYFRQKSGRRPSVQVEQPGLHFHLHLDGSEAILYVDFSGESLHRRGYRAQGTLAPLKETLAAAIVALSGWDRRSGVLVDPMCGSGTLLIEAALMFSDSAPGLSRKYFGFFGWSHHDEELWNRIVSEALDREQRGQQQKWPVLLGYDADPVAVSAARKNIDKAGLEDKIQVKQAELATLHPPAGSGLVLSNLPYGERLSEKRTVGYLYRCFGRILKTRFSGWKAGAFISNPELTDSFGLAWDKRERLYNGSLACRLLTTEVRGDDPAFVWSLPDRADLGEFGNRLYKNVQKTMKWANREGITCFRVYDRDLPEYNLSIDIYGKWVHVQEYAPPKSVDEEVAASRYNSALEAIRKTLAIRSDRLFVKTRRRQKGSSQYQKKDTRGKMYEVVEGDCRFLVNFTDYLDTGLFLDHRPVRKRIFQLARGKRFLNLFGYTGTATVHAALGGAASTTTVDLSATYLDWTKMNLALNGLGEVNNRVIKSDCIDWLQESNSKFDIIFIDPPTFSNTKKEKRVFDIQRDHVPLLDRAMRLLDSNGLLLFSTNFRRFRLDDDLLTRYDVVEITDKTIPFDFSRNKKIHRCWEIKKKTPQKDVTVRQSR
ncbi:bifunctional 23S rRNA (guanine(2069)-N(7))-methyltransferase RlmK/23S rRNA (guanine(2445)-N(2))-methyltransferase RlmL [Desulforhopalus singaporensis]|uniref:Ribosomal RNA large subunit methyltransferase K/L n=1 Tax=Desulforhopalus singaporensis TaxID=91360 RepID=A0A1H0V9E5_9BACT|nr:bifunctional 23S rRNA (guanine(2069)-N(7))-methyltransferase RlmK/23S rRNA (guanine(2445)-N(2))-methyltransferase RlmL [Desulforhopalus singaporensis]SDP75162.1 23S rRNA m(2)G-2445 methyltransferase [Desulforhopalus singaporensis]